MKKSRTINLDPARGTAREVKMARDWQSEGSAIGQLILEPIESIPDQAELENLDCGLVISVFDSSGTAIPMQLRQFTIPQESAKLYIYEGALFLRVMEPLEFNLSSGRQRIGPGQYLIHALREYDANYGSVTSRIEADVKPPRELATSSDVMQYWKEIGAVGDWADRSDIGDSAEYAAHLRRTAEQREMA